MMATEFVQCDICAALTVPGLEKFHQTWHKTLINIPRPMPETDPEDETWVESIERRYPSHMKIAELTQQVETTRALMQHYIATGEGWDALMASALGDN